LFIAEEEAKYPCDAALDVEAKGIPNNSITMNGHDHALNGYIPTIASHLEYDEKVSPEFFGHYMSDDSRI